MLRIYCSFIPVIGLIDIGSSMLQAMGRPNVSLASSFARNVMIVVLMVLTAGISSDAVFYSLATSELLGVVIMFVPAWALFRRYPAGGRPMPRLRYG